MRKKARVKKGKQDTNRARRKKKKRKGKKKAKADDAVSITLSEKKTRGANFHDLGKQSALTCNVAFFPLT